MHGKVSRWAFVLLLALGIAMPEPQQQLIQAPNPGGHLEQLAGSSGLGQDGPGLSVLYLRGTSYEMGLQQGTLLRPILRQLVQEYLYGHIYSLGPTTHWALLNYARFLDEGLPTDLRHEMSGIADGAALSYRDILLLNVLPDLQALTSSIPSWDLAPVLSLTSVGGAALGAYLRARPSGGTTALGGSFAVWGPSTQSGELFLGHSLAPAIPELARHWLLIVRQPVQGNASMSLGQVGSVGAWAGMNEEKVVVALSASASVDIEPLGQPLPFLLRQILQLAGSLDQARNVLLGSRRLCGGQVVLADGKAPDALVTELSAHRQATFEAQEDGSWLARTNHFVDRDLALMHGDGLASREQAWSEDRLAHSSTRLQLNSGWIGVEKATAFLKSGQDDLLRGPYPVEGSLFASPFAYSVLFCPTQLTAWVILDDALELLNLDSVWSENP